MKASKIDDKIDEFDKKHGVSATTIIYLWIVIAFLVLGLFFALR